MLMTLRSPSALSRLCNLSMGSPPRLRWAARLLPSPSAPLRPQLHAAVDHDLEEQGLTRSKRFCIFSSEWSWRPDTVTLNAE